MSRFNNYMNSHFAACTLLAEARDNCRNRDVRVYAVPGYTDCVGVTDGTDSWIAPVSASIFSVNIERQMQDMNAGCLKVVRRAQATGRRALLDEGPPIAPRPVKRRVLASFDEPQAPAKPTSSTSGGRRVLLA